MANKIKLILRYIVKAYYRLFYFFFRIEMRNDGDSKGSDFYKQSYYQSVSITIAYDAHGTLGGISTWARGSNFSISFTSVIPKIVYYF